MNHDPGFDSVPPPQVAVEDLLDGNGFITAWNVAGPFTKAGQEGKALFDVRFGPEMDADVAIWQPLDPKAVQGGVVIFDNVFEGDHRVAYLVTCLVAKKSERVTLGLGSDDGIKAWLNGEEVHANNAIRPVSKDSDKVQVQLKKGENILLLKVVDHTANWGACARIFSPEDK